MRNTIKIALIFQCLTFTSIGQKDYEKDKIKYFPKEKSQITIMKDNWGMYFKNDIASSLDPNSANYLFEIKMDSYGSLYPAESILKVIDDTDFDGEIEDYAIDETHSFHRMFHEDVGNKIQNAISAMPDEVPRTIYMSLLDSSKNRLNEDEYYERWQAYHHSQLMAKLNNHIVTNGFNRVIFFIHGYNVPYSLAVLQALSFYSLAKDTLKLIDEHTLLIPVYWPSNNAKYFQLEPEDFDTKNIPEYKRNGRLFLYYSTRCYYAAITLRKIINGLDNRVKIDVIAHSLGATIATSCLINTFTKLDYGCRQLKKNKFNATWSSQQIKHFKKKDPITYDLLVNFKREPIPNKDINVFLSAAAIPGVTTFTDLNFPLMYNKRFFVTVNQYDEMVTKDNIRRTVKQKFHVSVKMIRANLLSSTSLGCNYRCEADLTGKLFDRMVKPGLFEWREVSSETDHDVFTYIQQKPYLEFLKELLEINSNRIAFETYSIEEYLPNEDEYLFPVESIDNVWFQKQYSTGSFFP